MKPSRAARGVAAPLAFDAAPGTGTVTGAGTSTVRDWQAAPASKPTSSNFLTRDLLGSGANFRKFRLLPATMPVTHDT